MDFPFFFVLYRGSVRFRITGKIAGCFDVVASVGAALFDSIIKNGINECLAFSF